MESRRTVRQSRLYSHSESDDEVFHSDDKRGIRRKVTPKKSVATSDKPSIESRSVADWSWSYNGNARCATQKATGVPRNATSVIDNTNSVEQHCTEYNRNSGETNNADKTEMPSRESDSSMKSDSIESENGYPLTLSRRRVRHDSDNDGRGSIVDGLLFEIYDRWQGNYRDSFDSDTFTGTECSSTSEIYHCRTTARDRRISSHVSRSYLNNQAVDAIQSMIAELQQSTIQMSTKLVRQLKRKDHLAAKLRKNCDILTAIIQAASLKRRIDTRMRFSIEPGNGASAFDQWKDAMKAVARLPLGIPHEFRKTVWLNLADNYIHELKVDWQKTVRFTFNEKSNPDDNTLGLQIVKDLHRTGCTGFSGEDNEEERAVLKRVLLAYARWNKSVGYCQGFNVIAALLLDVMDRKEDDALKVMIYLVDHVLPDSYFANNLRALSVDMAVFRDLLRITYPNLSAHLHSLQYAGDNMVTGSSYEPPLTNVFTMQWFLTLFATCLPKKTVLRVWDSVLLEGSEVLLRAALVIWSKLSRRIMNVSSADEFYTLMGDLTQEMVDNRMLNPDSMLKKIYSLAPFPYPQLIELREKYTYNIHPLSTTMNAGKKSRSSSSHVYSDEDDVEDEDKDMEAVTCFTGIFPTQQAIKAKGIDGSESLGSVSDISTVGPGAFGVTQESPQVTSPQIYMERMSTDIVSLKKQYDRLKQRQKQAHIILAAASAKQKTWSKSVHVPKMEPAMAVNHLFIGKQGGVKKKRVVITGPYTGSLFASNCLYTEQLTKARNRTNIMTIGRRPVHCQEHKPSSRNNSQEKKSSQAETISSQQVSASETTTVETDVKLTSPETNTESEKCMKGTNLTIDVNTDERVVSRNSSEHVKLPEVDAHEIPKEDYHQDGCSSNNNSIKGCTSSCLPKSDKNTNCIKSDIDFKSATKLSDINITDNGELAKDSCTNSFSSSAVGESSVNEKKDIEKSCCVLTEDYNDIKQCQNSDNISKENCAIQNKINAKIPLQSQSSEESGINSDASDEADIGRFNDLEMPVTPTSNVATTKADLEYKEISPDPSQFRAIIPKSDLKEAEPQGSSMTNELPSTEISVNDQAESKFAKGESLIVEQSAFDDLDYETFRNRISVTHGALEKVSESNESHLSSPRKVLEDLHGENFSGQRLDNVKRTLSENLHELRVTSTLPDQTGALSLDSDHILSAARYEERCGSSSSSSSSSPTDLRFPTKPFNPFPRKQVVNSHRAETGVKLGLYKVSTLEQMDRKKGLNSSNLGKSSAHRLS